MEWAHVGKVNGKGVKEGCHRPYFFLGIYYPGICLEKMWKYKF
jgi:hypothetical protein